MFDALFIISTVICLIFTGAIFDDFSTSAPYFFISLVSAILFGKMASMDHKQKKQEERIKNLEQTLGIEDPEKREDTKNEN